MWGILIGLGSFGQIKASSEWLPAIYATREEAEAARVARNDDRCNCLYKETRDERGWIRDPNV